MSKWISLVVGTLTGGVARYALAGIVYRMLGTGFPHGTMAVNLSGCFMIGVLDSLAESKFLLGPNARVLLMIGFCGAFTTLSTLMLETNNLLKDGETLRALANLCMTIVGGFLLFRMGAALGEWI